MASWLALCIMQYEAGMVRKVQEPSGYVSRTSSIRICGGCGEMTMIYLRMKIWNYDASPRTEIYEERVSTEQRGIRLMKRLRNMFGALPSSNVGRTWLSRRSIDGHILEIIGLYERKETRLA
jgi:hypothetical protein